MRNRPVLALFFAAICMALVHAQTATPAPEVTGSVSGQVFCADTNQPARFATVTLVPAPEKKETPPAKANQPVEYSGPPATRTGLDGSFFFPKVKPGTYFLFADYAGYVSPVARLKPVEILSDDPADIEKVEKVLVKVIVAANKDTAHDLELERGAAISGTVRYDDGSPANEIQIAILRVGDDGKLSQVWLNLGGQMRSAVAVPSEDRETNDLGHYRVSGLPAGKYVVKTILPTETSSYGGLFGGPVMGTFRTDDAVALTVYRGNVFREKDAKPVDVSTGSERDSVDITIPLMGLYTISGSIAALSDGHPIKRGTVRLLFADDQSDLRSSDLGDDGLFIVRFVPEGEYILHVEGSGDFTIQPEQDPETGVTNLERKTTHSYASVELPISVHSDLSNVTINVPDKPAPDKSTAAAQKQ